MPKMAFTARGVEALKPQAKRVDYWSTDPQEPGFGLRVFPSGAKSWFVWTRKTRLGRPVRVTLGTFPDVGLADARAAAGDKRADVLKGTDPAAERRAQRAANRDTVRALFEAYEKHVEVRRKAGEFRSWPDVRRSFERDVLPAWGDQPVREIRRKDVIELVTAKALTGLTAANRLQAHLSMLFAYGAETDWLDANPVAGLRKRPERSHDRVLTVDEIKALWASLDGDAAIVLSRGAGEADRIAMSEGTSATLRDLFKTLLLTGQRLGETSRMAWVDVDLDAAVWTMPATDTKNRTAHRVPLSKTVKAILDARDERAAKSAAYVFPSSPSGESSVLVWSKRTAKAISAAVGFRFTAHDLRRTVATGLGELGIPQDVIGLVLNHRKPGVTGRHYDLSTREAAKRDALDRWANHVDAIVTGKIGKVVSIRRRGRKGGAA
jgi:integrase